MWSYITDKARKRCFSISQKCAPAGHLTPKIALQLYDSFVSPVLNYMSELWSKIDPIDCIERFN